MSVIRGYKELAQAADVSVRTCQDLVATYPDPLPAKRFRGNGIWAFRERVDAWRRRHAKTPDASLVRVTGWLSIATVVRLSAVRAKQLAPWTDTRDPLPVHHEAGEVWAYRDALLDWLDRQFEPPSRPRIRRPWPMPKVRAKKAARRSG